MDDAISRSAVMEQIGKLPLSWEYGQAVTDCWEIVRQSPAIDVAPVVHARWQDHYCSNCFARCVTAKTQLDFVINVETPHCPYCGARMDGEDA